MSSLIIKSKVEIDNWLNHFIIMSKRLFENHDTLVNVENLKSKYVEDHYRPSIKNLVAGD